MRDGNILDKRYQNDSVFRTLVDHFYHLTIQLQTTPSEIRDAAMFAQMKMELERPHAAPVCLSHDLVVELERRGVKTS